MESERWRQVEELFQAALEKHPHERAAFIAEADASDDVRDEVASLLSQSASGLGPLDRPAWSGAVHDATESLNLPVASGTILGPYRIDQELGRGGMGVVYLARDTRLNRPVAIKFLSEHLASDALRRRFQREARLASALNHPHILTVHEAGELEGRLYLVTELVDGGTLREWLRENRRWEDVLDLLVGVADGLAVAHAARILHRDIKPANILVSKTGYAKLADFGLAKLGGVTGQQGGPSINGERTIPGAIVGTIAYMSPEQAAGGPVDVRSDIFSFGVVLYEALAGYRPFAADSDLDVLHQIRSQPPAALPAHIPAGVRIVVEKSLAKHPEDRYQSMREVVADLKRLQRGRSDEISQSASNLNAAIQRWRYVFIVCSAVTLIGLAALLWVLWKRDYFWQNPLEGAKVERLTDFEGDEAHASVSPDGKLVAFASNREGQYDVFISQIGSGEFVNVTKGRVGAIPPAPIRRVGFSHDGGRIWLLTGDGSTRPYQSWLASVVGGNPHPFLGPGMEVSWSPDGSQIVYHTDDPGDPLFVSDSSGSNARRIYVEKPGGHCHQPIWSPDGRFIYFVKGMPNDELDIWRVPADGSSSFAERITRHNARVGSPAWLDNRTLIYSATAEVGSGQWLYTLDIERRIPHRISSGVLEQYQSVTVSQTLPRRIVCTVARPAAGLWKIPVSSRIEPETSANPVAVQNTRAFGPRFAGDDLLFLSSRHGFDGIWRWDGSTARELWRGSDGAVLAPPSVSPDGTRICFSWRKQGRAYLSVMNANGTDRRIIAETLEVRSSPAWSPDGKTIAVAATENEGTRLHILPVDGGSPVRLVDTPSYDPVWSPDGRYIVYSEPLRGAQLALKAITLEGAPVNLPAIIVPYTTATPFRFAPGEDALIYMKDVDYPYRNFYRMDLATGRERRLTDLNPRDVINSFDVSPDGRYIVFDRSRDNSDIVMFELRR